MTNIHYLNSFKAAPIPNEKLSDNLIDKLYDFAPKSLFFWALQAARIRFNKRIKENKPSWFDKLKVYVGLPDWILTEAQIEEENSPHLKVPFGLIDDVLDISFVDFKIAIPFQRINSDTGEAYNSLHHTVASQFATKSYNIESDIMNKKGAFEDSEDMYEKLIEDELNNIWKKKQIVIEHLREDQWYDERLEVLLVCLSTCMGLAEGDRDLIQAFINLEDVCSIGEKEARRIYSNLTIEDFFDWGTDHFGLDDYFTDSEDLIDNIKFFIEEDETTLLVNKHFKFVTQIIARSEKQIEYG